ncbi:MAG: PEP-CTERM sorting domain-containing protein [Alphaproteobacteria bacterium]|nr:PEP-CTERM sorting domain-containing protein [Alphaproteobacteria bacterium]MDP6813248.1 PEP-CTERM sorting domain-containing protein [Alphaproteobacteria bacterium]
MKLQTQALTAIATIAAVVTAAGTAQALPTELLADIVNLQSWDFGITSLKVIETPEPGSMFVLGTGIVGLIAARRRKK